MEPSIAELGTGLGIVLVAILCGLLILIGGVVVAVARSGILGNLLSLLGTVAQPEGQDEGTGVSRVRRRGRVARDRAAEIRARYDREFDAQSGDMIVRPAGSISVPPEGPSNEPALLEDEGWTDPLSGRRRRSRGDDFDDDELDAYLEESEL